MLRTISMIIHVAGGFGGLLAGAWVLRPAAAAHRQRVRQAYWLCLIALLGSVVVMIAIDWPGLAQGARIAFVALVGLGTVMLARLGLAERQLAAGAPGWQARYLGHIYFTYISLWIGLVIVPALRLPLPQLAAPLAAVVVLAAGQILLARHKRRALSQA